MIAWARDGRSLAAPEPPIYRGRTRNGRGGGNALLRIQQAWSAPNGAGARRMSQNGDIMTDLDAVGGIVARAESELAAGVVLDLSPLESQVESLCARIESLPPGEGRPLQSKLLALADAFGRLGQSIETAMDDVKAEVGEISGRQRVANACAESSEPTE